jgi:hypothetical protein
MGQYYKPINIDKKECICPHDIKGKYKGYDGKMVEIGQGAKLMEHSYIGNPLLNAVESLLIPSGAWYKAHLVWAGDYADPEKGTTNANYTEGRNLYDLIDEENGTKLTPPFSKRPKEFHYLTNHDLKCVIDLNKIKKDSEGFKIHPLSLLICEGNGRGGGDFHGEDSRIGSWARNSISLESQVLEDYQLCDPEDGQFKEER